MGKEQMWECVFHRSCFGVDLKVRVSTPARNANTVSFRESDGKWTNDVQIQAAEMFLLKG